MAAKARGSFSAHLWTNRLVIKICTGSFSVIKLSSCLLWNKRKKNTSLKSVTLSCLAPLYQCIWKFMISALAEMFNYIYMHTFISLLTLLNCCLFSSVCSIWWYFLNIYLGFNPCQVVVPYILSAIKSKRKCIHLHNLFKFVHWFIGMDFMAENIYFPELTKCTAWLFTGIQYFLTVLFVSVL